VLVVQRRRIRHRHEYSCDGGASMLSAAAMQLDYLELTRQSKRLDVSKCTRTVRIALLSDAEIPQLVPLVRVLLARHDINAELYRAEYDSIELEVFNEQSHLYAFAPDVIVLLHATNALRFRFFRQQGDRSGWAEETAEKLAALWDTIRGRTPALIVQSNF